MLRHATRRLVYVPGVTLDFLLPRRYTLGAAQQVRTQLETSRESDSTHLESKNAKPEILQCPSCSAKPPLTVSKLYLEGEDVGAFEQAKAELRDALGKEDVETAARLWSSLGQKRLTSFLGTHDWMAYSSSIETLHRPGKPVFSLKREVVCQIEDIAVMAAAHGASTGLQATILRYLRNGYPNEVIRLFDQLNDFHLSRSASPIVPLDTIAVEEEETSMEEVETDASTTAVPLSILIYTITAYAMKDDFHAALRASLRVSNALTLSHFKTFAPPTKLSRDIQAKAETFATRIVAAQVLSRPGNFERRIATISTSTAARRSVTLRSLYDIVIDALQGPQAWLTLDPSKVSEQTPVLLPPSFWAVFLKVSLRSRQMELASKLWDDMTKLQVPPTMEVWTALLEGYGELRMADRALQTWEIMQTQKLVPSVMAHRAFIFCLFNSGLTDRAMRHFATVEGEVRAGRYSMEDSETMILFNTELHWLLLNGKVSEAQALFDRMKEQGPKPDVVTYNSWMRFYGKTGQLRALGTLLQEMSAVGVKEDVVTYTTILTALLPKDPNASQMVFNLMKKRGLEANVAMYTAVIDSLMKQQVDVALKAAFDILQKMEAENTDHARPNVITYTTVLCGIHRYPWADPAAAEEHKRAIIQKMEAKSMMYSTVTYNILIKACFENPSAEGARDALKYYRDMVRKRIEPNYDTWYILLLGLKRRKDWDQADMVVEHIGKQRRQQAVPAWLMSLISTVKQRRDVRQKKRKTYAL